LFQTIERFAKEEGIMWKLPIGKPRRLPDINAIICPAILEGIVEIHMPHNYSPVPIICPNHEK